MQSLGYRMHVEQLFCTVVVCCALGCHSKYQEAYPPQSGAPFTQSFPAPPVASTTVVEPRFVAPAQTSVLQPESTVFVPVTDQEWTWEQMVDVVDDYFRVEREQRVQLVGTVVTEGRIDTYPQIGSTWLEPHRPDSDGYENRWESTLQTIRRRAVLRILPQQGGYLVQAEVLKEIEDLPRPENSTAGASVFRSDTSLDSRLSEEVSRTRLSEQWVPLGRDCNIEQQMLAEIAARVAGGPRAVAR